MLALAARYDQVAHVAGVAGAPRGTGAVAAWPVIATTLKLLPARARNPLGMTARVMDFA